MVPDIHQNGIITLYEVSYQPVEVYDSTVLLQNTSELSISLTGLHEYANYREHTLELDLEIIAQRNLQEQGKQVHVN